MALLVGALGVRSLTRQAERSAAASAQLLATTLAERAARLVDPQRHELFDRTSRRSGAAIWYITSNGRVLDDVTPSGVELDPNRALHDLKGELTTASATWSYAARSAGSSAAPSVVVAVEIPDPPEGVRAMILGLLTLTTLLLGVAVAVAQAVSRDVKRDVEALSSRVREIAARGRETTDRAQDTVAVHALDEVGELAVAFNGLVERFAVAESTYADALARIEEIDRERSAFLATVSHELRSPLNAILGFADILLSEVDGPLVDEAREEVAVIKQSGLHLLGLINDILELSAIASGQLRLQPTMTDLVPIADEVIREARGARGDKPIVMRVESVAPSCLAFVDARRVRQILQNLVGNAVKFTPKGEVVVGIDRDGRWAIVRVRDTGPGIPREEREAIFDEYRQGGDRRSRRRGTGLGLAIARRLAVMHGGTIRLESEVGIGSTFVVRLPVKAAPTRPASSEDPRARAASLPSILEEPDAEVPRSSRRHAGGLS